MPQTPHTIFPANLNGLGLAWSLQNFTVVIMQIITLFVASLVACASPNPNCPADFTDNGQVDTDDLLYVMQHWGRCDTDNILLVVNNWGDCPAIAVQIKRVRMIGAGDNGNHFCKGENAVLHEPVTSAFSNEVKMLEIDSTESGAATNSRMAGISTLSGVTCGASAYYNETHLRCRRAIQFGSKRGEQIFCILNAVGTRLFDIVARTSDDLALYDKGSTSMPIEIGSETYADDEKVILWIDFFMGGTTGDGRVSVRVSDERDRTIETISTAGVDFGDADGGEIIGDCFDGMVLDRSVGECVINVGENSHDTINGFLPNDTRTQWIRADTRTSSANGWTVQGTSDYGAAVRVNDSTNASNGTYIRYPSSAGTGSGSTITFDLQSIESTDLDSGTAAVYGVTVRMDCWSDLSASTEQLQLTWHYSGADYSMTNGAQCGKFVLSNGGHPHTRCLGFFGISGTAYIGPDNKPWDVEAIADSTISVTVTNDAIARNVTCLAVGVTFSP